MNSTGMQLIRAERARQVDVEGFTPDHDDEHGGRVLWEAAECYEAGAPAGIVSLELTPFSNDSHALRWPWEGEAWKPGTAPRNLIRAGALYLAAAECFRRTRDDRPNKPWPLANGQTEADRVAWVLWLADLCEASAVRLAEQVDQWLAFAAEVQVDPASYYAGYRAGQADRAVEVVDHIDVAHSLRYQLFGDADPAAKAFLGGLERASWIARKVAGLPQLAPSDDAPRDGEWPADGGYRRTRETCLAAAGALMGVVGEVDDDDLAQMLAERAMQFEREAATLAAESVTSGLSPLADQLANYLAVRQHTLSTARLTGLVQILAEAEYVRDEAQELLDAVKALVAASERGEVTDEHWRHVRDEIADVALSDTCLAGMLPGAVTVEACIEAKAEADRGRG